MAELKVSAEEARILMLDGQEKIKQKLESDIAACLEDIGHKIVQAAAQGEDCISLSEKDVRSACWLSVREELEKKHFVVLDHWYGGTIRWQEI